jgi:hypothetical protein
MSYPTLTPASTASAVVLASAGSPASVDASLPYRIYSDESSPLYSSDFLSGAAEQVAHVYKKLGGDVLDIEITAGNVYAAYEEACLEYSYIVNLHQATNLLSSALGASTGSFDHKGHIKETDPGATPLATVSGSHVALRYPKFDYGYSRRTAEAASSEVGLNSSVQFSASFHVTASIQDYDLHSIVSSSAEAGDVPWADSWNDKKILVKKVYYKTPHAMWRFYGYYGGLNVVGNLHSYGQFSDDSSFQLIPTWQNKAQALAFEDAIYTRMSHFSYELHNNNLRLFPIPQNFSPTKMWIEFSFASNAWDDDANGDNMSKGVNNMNTLPLANIPYESINSIGKQWIRRFSLALCKEMLGHVRSKFATVPIPGESVTLNGSDLMSQGREDQEKLREELKTTLAEMTYVKLSESDATITDNANKVMVQMPMHVFVG